MRRRRRGKNNSKIAQQEANEALILYAQLRTYRGMSAEFETATLTTIACVEYSIQEVRELVKTGWGVIPVDRKGRKDLISFTLDMPPSYILKNIILPRAKEGELIYRQVLDELAKQKFKYPRAICLYEQED